MALASSGFLAYEGAISQALGFLLLATICAIVAIRGKLDILTSSRNMIQPLSKRRSTDETIKLFKYRAQATFMDVPQPDDDNIVGHKCYECETVRRDFSGKKWGEVSAEIVKRNYDKLPLFTPEAFHFYLPAYLTHAVEDLEGDLAEFTFYQIDISLPEYRNWLSKRINKKSHEFLIDLKSKKLALFNDDQFKVLLEFLDMLPENLDAMRARQAILDFMKNRTATKL